MKLKPINPPKPIFTIICLKCGKKTTSDKAYADLDGEPFKAYYCEDCGKDILFQTRNNIEVKS